MAIIILEGKEYQLDVEQAKKLNLLKENNNKIRSWEEYIKKYSNTKSYAYNNEANIIMDSPNSKYTAEQLTPHEAKALAAFSKLIKLRRDWIGEWEPDWEDESGKCVIRIWRNHIYFEVERNNSAALSFPTDKMAKEFLETFRSLIEQAKILI